MTQTATNDIDLEKFQRENTRFLLRMKREDLQASEDYSPSDIYQELRRFNADQATPLSDEDFTQETADLLTPAPDPTAAMTIDLAPYQQAIKDKDKEQLYKLGPSLARLKLLSPLNFAIITDQIEEAFGKTLNKKKLNSIINYEERKQRMAALEIKKDVATVAHEWAMQNRDLWAYDEDRQCWRKWNGEYWQEEKDKASTLDQYAIIAMQDAGIQVNSKGLIDTFQRIAASHLREKFTQPQGKINFANGTLDTSTMKISKHERENHFTYCLSYVYDSYSQHPYITKYLTDTVPDTHARQAIMAHIGLALMGDTYMHNFILLIGPTRGGKSTLLAIVNALCGAPDPWNFAGPSLFSRELEGKRSRAMWSKQRLAAIDELPSEALREEGILKTMSGHGGLEERAIGKDENLDNRWRAKLLMCTNDTPHYKDTSGAIKQRAIIIECPNGPRPDAQQDKMLFPEKLFPELGAFAATCIRLGKLALKKGYYPRSKEMQKLLDRIASAGNPLKAFLSECCYIDPQEKTPANLIHTPYKDYCNEDGNKPLAKNKFSSALHDMHLGITLGWMRAEGKPTRCYHGIRLREDGDPEPEGEQAYKDTDLLEPATVNGVNDAKSIVDAIVDALDPLIEDVYCTSSTVSTIDCQKYSIRDTVCKEALHTHHFSIQATPPQVSLTPLTPNMNEPVEPSHNGKNVTKHQNQPLTPSHQPLTPSHQPLTLPEHLAPDHVTYYPQEVIDWHEAKGLKLKKSSCTRGHRNAPYLPWYNKLGEWENLCTACYPGLRTSKGRECEAVQS